MAEMTRIYLDYNATAPLLPVAREALIEALDAANPSAVHREGRAARMVVETARRSLAALVGADPEKVVFTGSATEAAATLLAPDWIVGGKSVRLAKLAVLETDHACLREGGRFLPDDLTRLPVDANGLVRIDALARWAERFGEGQAGLLAIGHANSETGVVQDLVAIRRTIAGRPIRFVLDAVQTAGRITCDIVDGGADAIVLSGHKLGAAKGVGALILADPQTRPLPLLRGGGQEKGRRAGTEPVAAIASLGAAAELVSASRSAEQERQSALRRRIEEGILKRRPDALILGAAAERLPNTVALALPGLAAETAQMALDLSGFAVSAGSACSSGKVGRSHVVDAMMDGGLPEAVSRGAVRVSLGRATTSDEIDRFIEAFADLADRILRPIPVLGDESEAVQGPKDRAA